jgi:hypothetical protein
LNDGAWTEVRGDELKEGMEVVIGEQIKKDQGSTGTVNPFTPKLPSRTRTPAAGKGEPPPRP